MSKKKKDVWFPAKKYGVGWGLPVTWQGWVVFILYMVMITVPSFMVTGSSWGKFFFCVLLHFTDSLACLYLLEKGRITWFQMGRQVEVALQEKGLLNNDSFPLSRELGLTLSWAAHLMPSRLTCYDSFFTWCLYRTEPLPEIMPVWQHTQLYYFV